MANFWNTNNSCSKITYHYLSPIYSKPSNNNSNKNDVNSNIIVKPNDNDIIKHIIINEPDNNDNNNNSNNVNNDTNSNIDNNNLNNDTNSNINNLNNDNENASLTIYLSPIPLTPPTSRFHQNDIFIAKHKLEFSQEKINYNFNNTHSLICVCNAESTNLPNFTVTNSNFNITNNGENYILQDFHMHYPAEHTLNDIQHALEIHFVFIDSSSITNSEDNEDSIPDPSNALVLGYFFKIANRSSKIVKQLLKEEPFYIESTIDHKFCTYNGSLTKINLEDIHQLSVNWNLVYKIKEITVEDLLALLALNYARDASALRPADGRNVIYIKK